MRNSFLEPVARVVSVVSVTTVAVNLLINTDQLDWSVTRPPADWASDRDRWQIAHAVRTVAAVLAFGCLVLSSGLHRRRQSVELAQNAAFQSYELSIGGNR